MNDCPEHCTHCAVSEPLMARQPLTFQDTCSLGQVIADIVASIPT